MGKLFSARAVYAKGTATKLRIKCEIMVAQRRMFLTLDRSISDNKGAKWLQVRDGEERRKK